VILKAYEYEIVMTTWEPIKCADQCHLTSDFSCFPRAVGFLVFVSMNIRVVWAAGVQQILINNTNNECMSSVTQWTKKFVAYFRKGTVTTSALLTYEHN